MVSFIPSITYADPGGFYVGGGLGTNHHKGLSKAANDYANATLARCASTATTCAVESSADADDLGGSLLGGYRFRSNTALELGVIGLGEYIGKGRVSGGLTGTAELGFKGSALSFSILQFLPVSTGGSFVGKAGLAGWKVEGTTNSSSCTTGTTTCTSSRSSSSKSGASPVIGFGYEQWDRFHSVGIRALFEAIPRVGIDPNYDTVKRFSVNLMTYF
jgi:hypothetical protein